MHKVYFIKLKKLTYIDKIYVITSYTEQKIFHYLYSTNYIQMNKFLFLTKPYSGYRIITIVNSKNYINLKIF